MKQSVYVYSGIPTYSLSMNLSLLFRALLKDDKWNSRFVAEDMSVGESNSCNNTLLSSLIIIN